MSKVSDETLAIAAKGFWERGPLPFVGMHEYDIRLRAALEAVSSIHEDEPVAWQHRGKRRGAAVFGEWCDGRNQSYDTAEGAEFEERRVYAHPAPISKGMTVKTLEAEMTAQCCMCGKIGLSTVEGDGGTECQLSDGRWTCSRDCWEEAAERNVIDKTKQDEPASRFYDSGLPAWQEINRIMEGEPVSLSQSTRDELAGMLLWARYATRVKSCLSHTAGETALGGVDGPPPSV